MPEPCPIQQIEQQLADSIEWNQARIKFLARFLVAVIAVKTVCLTQIATAFPGAALPASHYKRIQRFLAGFEMDFAAVAKLVVSFVGQEPPWVLSLDRTNWKLGRTEINLLVLALVYRGVGFPLVWTVLGRAGNSSTAQRQALLERFVALFGAKAIRYLCADREFVGKAWLSYLLERGIDFRLRVKSDTLVSNARGRLVVARGLFRHGRVHEGHALSGARQVWGRHVFVSGMRLPQGQFLIVLSAGQSADALCEYGQRWGIETLFGCLKQRGFCLEATHVTEAERLEKLLALLVLAFCWAFVAGAWLSEQMPLRIKKHGRAAVSLFRRGFDWLRRVLLPLCGRLKQTDFQITAQFLSCT